jgi:hypothetical protein
MTAEFAARISRIRIKGGADVHVLRSKPGLDGKDDWRGAIVRNARAVAEMGSEKQPLVGYVLVGFFGDGTSSVGYRYDPESCPIPRALIPAWLAEVIRRDLITSVEASNVFHEMFEWRGGPTG